VKIGGFHLITGGDSRDQNPLQRGDYHDARQVWTTAISNHGTTIFRICGCPVKKKGNKLIGLIKIEIF